MEPNAQLANAEFQKSLAFGQAAETAIAKWLIRTGRAVLPIYDVEYHTGKGPRLFHAAGQHAAPDLLVWGKNGVSWIEAKHKSVFSWNYRENIRAWETGIDANHWRAYQEVQRKTGHKVWLLFLHRCSTPDARDLRRGCPSPCPTGLFGQSIDHLAANISHEWKVRGGKNGYGRHGMVYWAHETLTQYATLDEVEQA